MPRKPVARGPEARLVFMAPEVVEGHAATPASDVYSLGAVLSAAVEGGDPGALARVRSVLTHADPTSRPTAAQVRELLADGRQRREFPFKLVAVAVTAAVAAAAAVVVTWPNQPLSGPDLVGEPRSADPCALVDENAVRQFVR